MKRYHGLKLGALKLLAPTNSKQTFNLAAYHSRHSLTWSWILSLSFSGAWRKPDGRLRLAFSPWKANTGGQWVLVVPFVALQWHRQHEMWFREMFYRAREREDALERQVSKLQRKLVATQEAAALSAHGEAH